jgi:excinuclease UvrABC nuclease subunit
MAVVYTHTRLDNNQVFYVGVGKHSRRAYSKNSRNSHWYNIVNKHGYKVTITHKDICYEEALSIEKYLVAFYGRKDLGKGSLVNKTEGGDGTLGAIVSEETRAKKSVFFKGRKHSEETKAIMSIAQSNRSTETRRRLSDAKRGKLRSEETKAKISLRKMGQRCNSKKVVDINTGIVYKCAIDAADFIGVKPTTLRAWLRGENNNKTSLRR